MGVGVRVRVRVRGYSGFQVTHGIFGVGKFGKFFFGGGGGWRDLCIFFFLCVCVRVQGGGGGFMFSPGFFVGFVGSPRDLFWFLIFGSIRSSPSLEI